MSRKIFSIILCMMLVVSVFVPYAAAAQAGQAARSAEAVTSASEDLSSTAEEQNYYQDYVNILYNSENGLPTSEANDVVQTDDGFIWIASYSGLIRYDGSVFLRLSDADGAASANKLFIDSQEHLWVGTNDNGIMMYDHGTYTTYNNENGLPSNSVKAVAEDSAGNIYVGTTSGVAFIDAESGEIMLPEASDMDGEYINSMDILPDDTVLCVTNNGKIFTVNGRNVSSLTIPPETINAKSVKSVYAVHASDISETKGQDSQPDSRTSASVVLENAVTNKTQSAGESGEDSEASQYEWFFGSDGNEIYRCTGTAQNFSCETINCGTLSTINSMKYISDGTLWVCSDNGIGYFDAQMGLHLLSNLPVNNSVDNMIEDYEGNLWFSSSRQGVFKGTRNYFNDVSKKAGLEELVVNSTVKYGKDLYVASDSGLFIISEKNTLISSALTDYLADVRIRCLLTDSSGNLWLCTYGDTGLVRYDGKTITSISDAQGLNASKVRSAIECSDGSIMAATSDGIYTVKDGAVVSYTGEDEGLTNPEVLSLCEAPDGSIYAGTDGGGVCVIKDGKVTETISSKDGLRSDIVMRIKYDSETDGFWFITSNSIALCRKEIKTPAKAAAEEYKYNVKTIEKFPYSNNYDMYFGPKDSVWILSSNGIYVTTRKSLLDADALMYTFYDHNSGMPSTPTSNSFSYVDEESQTLYGCGSSGVFSIYMNNDDEIETTTKLTIPDVVADGVTLWEKEGKITVSSDTKRLKIDAYALSYGLQNPLIEYYMEGFDDDKMIVRKSEFTDVEYTNLSGGDYVFHIAVADPNNGEEIVSKSLAIHKEYKATETPLFPIMLLLLSAAIIGIISYVVMKFRMNRIVLAKEEEQKQVLQDALETAKSASEAKGQFLSRMSHEIRTPLNAVIGYMDIAKDSQDNLSKIMHCVENSDMAARHLLSIINDVLDMSSIESGKMKIAHEEFDLRKQITTITTLFFNQAREKNVNFDVQIKDVTEEWVVGDGLRLNQVMMNLLSNAVKFTPENGKITLTVTQLRIDEKAVYMRFEVSDTGIGMSEEYRNRLFQPFEQESATTAQKYGGTGLGLSITKNLVNMMGGNIDVQSVQGEGTTFTVSLHFGRTENVHEKKSESQDYSHVRVLVVDDDKEGCAYIKALLKRCGVKSDSVNDGEAAVKQIKRRMGSEYEYDMCIMDWNMPGIDGIETARRIKEECQSDIPIIIATAYDITECEDEAKKVGVDRVIAKPLFQSTMFDLLVSAYGKYEPHKTEVSNSEALRGMKVLLAEDNTMNLEIAVNILEKAGIVVDAVTDGKQAYDRFMSKKSGAYDAILMDVQMPVMDGYTATGMIRKSGHPDAKSIQIIAMTANAFAEDVTDALASGMNGHISKPVDYDKLFEALSQAKNI